MKTPAFYYGLLLGMALLVGMPLSAAAKCRNKPSQMGGYPTEPEVSAKIALVLDGRQTTKAELETMDPGSIESIQVLCWRSADSTFAMSPDMAVGMSVIRIITKGLVDRLVAELYRATEAGSSGVRVATDDGIVVELSADKTQWSATLKQGALVHRCVLDVGSTVPSSTSERQRTCAFSIAEGEKYTMSTEG